MHIDLFLVRLYSPVSEIMFYCNVPSFDLLYDKAYLIALNDERVEDVMPNQCFKR